MKQKLKILLIFALLLEIGFQIEFYVQQNINTNQEYENSDLTFFGGSIIHQIKDEIQNSIDQKITFYTYPRLSTEDILKKLSETDIDSTSKYYLIMVGNDEVGELTLSSVKKDRRNFTCLSYRYLSQIFNQNSKASFFKEEIRNLFNKDISSDRGLKLYYKIQNYQEQLKNAPNELENFNYDLETFISSHLLKNLFPDFTARSSLSIEEASRLQYIASYANLFKNSSLSGNVLSSILTIKDKGYMSAFRAIEDLFKFQYICESEKEFAKANILQIDKITLCHLINRQKDIQNEKRNQFPMDSISFIFGYIYNLAKKLVPNSIAQIQWLEHTPLETFEKVFQEFLKQNYDEKRFNKNIKRIQNILTKRDASLILIQYPGYNNDSLTRIASDFNIPIIQNSSSFLNQIEAEGFYQFFEDKLGLNTGHLNSRGTEAWIQSLKGQLREIK